MTEHEAAVPSVGEELAQARQALGLSVVEVAQQLKFSARQIEALEAGRFAELPTGTFARGMVRAYGRLLKLDAEPLVARVAGLVAVPDNVAAVAATRRPIPIIDTARRTNLLYAVLSVAILGVIAGVALQWQRESTSAARMTFVPAARAPQPQQPPTTVASTVTPTMAPLEAEKLQEKAVEKLQEKAQEKPAGGQERIQFRFERDSWVEVRGRDGRVLTSELNRGGTERVVEGRPPFLLVIGNAQHVRLRYGEQDVDLTPHVKVEVARLRLE